MAYNAQGVWTPEDDSVSTKLAGVMSQDNDLMKGAATRGAQTASRRGLLNSSMGVEASQKAMLDVAVPVASQDASQVAQKNLSYQQFGQNKTLQDADIASKEKIAAQNTAAYDRQYAMSALAKASESYQASFMNIAKEYNLPEAARNTYTSHLGRVRDSDLNLIEQMYGIDLVWGSTDPGTTSGLPSGGSTMTPGTPSSEPLIN